MNYGDSSAFVLYVDHQGHPAPLSLSYHATASRRLASSVNRHPPSTITEVDSAYCPQCLSFHDVTTASNLGYCPKATCRLCPLCQSVAAVAVEDGSAMYQCGRCDWTSQSCGLQTPIAQQSEDGSISAEELERATDELGTQYETIKQQHNQAAEEHYKSMLSTLQSMAKDQVRGLRSPTTTSNTTTASSSTSRYFSKRSKRGAGLEDGAWSIQALEESMKERAKLYASAALQPIGDLKDESRHQQLVSLEVEMPYHESLQGVSVDSILLQPTALSTTTIASNNNTNSVLLPLPIPLQPRKSRRCRAELAEGRPGILLKPKLNPLEGDSSLRSGHGQWWKKDSSATEVLPRMGVSIHASDGSRHAFLLKVSNPTLGTVRLKLAVSSYQGETEWDDPATTSSMLEQVMVDPLTQQIVDAQLDTSVSGVHQETEPCELEAAEDSFLQLGKTSDNDTLPEPVAKWEAGDILFDSKVSKDALPLSIKLVGQKKSVAWFELVLVEPALTRDDVFCAVPLSLQIQVGDGSWDSSLVQTQQLEEGDPDDFISFDVVICWEQFD